jgi:hypothetical protein
MEKSSFKKSLLCATLIVAASTLYMACKKNSSSGPANPAAGGGPVRAYKGTQAPGDVWNWTLNDTAHTFTAVWDHGTTTPSDDITLQGVWSELTTGYLKLVIRQSNPADPQVPVDGSAYFYALEVPGVALFLKPEGSILGDNIISSVYHGATTGYAGAYNWVHAALPSAADALTSEGYGTLTLTESSPGNLTVTGHTYSLDYLVNGVGTVNHDMTPSSATVDADGSLVLSGGGVGQATSSGSLIIDYGAGNGGVFAGRQDNTLTMEGVSGSTYNCFSFRSRGVSDDEGRIRFVTADSAVYESYANVETGALGSITVPFKFSGIRNGAFSIRGYDSPGVPDNGPITGFAMQNGTSKVLAIMSISCDSDPTRCGYFILGASH